MPCIGRSDRPTKAQRLEESAMKNGFKPGVYEKHGLYVGNWQNDTKQGKGKKIYRNKTIYEGDWVANKRHGYGVLMKKLNDHYVFVCEGKWINNLFADGKLYEKNGIYDGGFSIEGRGTRRIKCGYGTMVWNDGAVYRGHWRNNKYDGVGRYSEVNGNYYDGQWRNGEKHGEGVYVFKDAGQYMKGVWIDGIPKISEIKYLEEKIVADAISMDLGRPVIPEWDILAETNYDETRYVTKLKVYGNYATFCGRKLFRSS